MIDDGGPEGPSPDDLALIEAEWPLIEAELAVLDAEIRMVSVRCPSELDWRRLRRAEQRVMRTAAALAACSVAACRAA